MLPQLIDIGSKFKQIMLPQQCLLCAAPAGSDGICRDCNADLPWQHDPCCPVCALPSGTGEVCGTCLQHSPAFDATLAPLMYQFPINLVLQRYKYAGRLAVAEVTGELLADGLQVKSKPDVIIPMPLHPSRFLERGFNQAAEICPRRRQKVRYPARTARMLQNSANQASGWTLPAGTQEEPAWRIRLPTTLGRKTRRSLGRCDDHRCQPQRTGAYRQG
jgi:predicted amidophosphoribosyltransferase